jgi:broad specificity polyphosphatase/5'/3'-nucleotidase SurE
LPPSQIKGVRLARRAGLLLDIGFDAAGAAAGRQTWKLRTAALSPDSAAESDAALHAAGYVVVVPMHADEHDEALSDSIRPASLPPWTAPRP